MTSNRLNIVRQLLATGRLVKEAAFTAGFRQQGNLTRQFKKYYKVSPRSLHDL
jgi:AraC-like DNA-binding protein